MKQGLLISKIGDMERRAIFVDQETMEFDRQNHRVQKRLDFRKAQQNATVKRVRKHKKEVYRLIRQECVILSVCFGTYLAQRTGLASCYLTIPIMVCCLATICFKAGRYMGRRRQ